jgi:hypothetical protein
MPMKPPISAKEAQENCHKLFEDLEATEGEELISGSARLYVAAVTISGLVSSFETYDKEIITGKPNEDSRRKAGKAEVLQLVAHAIEKYKNNEIIIE